MITMLDMALVAWAGWHIHFPIWFWVLAIISDIGTSVKTHDVRIKR